MFSKRHYDEIAYRIAQLNPNENLPNYRGKKIMWEDMIDSMCIMFSLDNNRFNQDKFVKACKLTGKENNF